MQISRIIPILSILLLALHGAGVVRTLHNLSHHDQPSISHACNDGSSHSAPTNQAPSEQSPEKPSERPSDRNDDHDCDLCLTINSITPTQSAPQLHTLDYQTKDSLFEINTQTLPYSTQQLDDHAARAPPIC